MLRQALASAHLVVSIDALIPKLAEPQYVASRVCCLPVATADSGKLIGAAKAVLRRIVQDRLVEQDQSWDGCSVGFGAFVRQQIRPVCAVRRARV